MGKTAKESIHWLWQLLASMKLAVILILSLTGISLFGTFAAPVAFFHTGWFLIPGFLLMLNILVCSINRWKGIKAILHGGKVRQPEAFYTGADGDAETLVLPDGAASLDAALADRLKRQRYRVRRESDSSRFYLAADKNRLFKLGTYVSHLSLILFVLAAIIGSLFGFRETGFIVAEQETRAVGHDTGLSLSLLSFTAEYYPDKSPKDYRSEIVLYKDGSIVSQTVIRVNHPLSFEGNRFYQSFFGPAIRVRLNQAGQPEAIRGVALSASSISQGYQRLVGTLPLAGSSLLLRFTGSAVNAADPTIPKGQLAVEVWQNSRQTGVQLLEKGKAVKVAGIEVTYLEDSQYSGFQVSRDPGNLLIWIASCLFVLGTMAVLFFPHIQIWVRIQPAPAGNSLVTFRMNAPRGFSHPAELAKIIPASENAIHPPPSIGEIKEQHHG